MIEVRGKNCGKLLVKFNGAGEIKCPKYDCSSINKFNTQTGEQSISRPDNPTPMRSRTTASGVMLR